MTPLLLQWTFQAMVAELLGMDLNRVDLTEAPDVRPYGHSTSADIMHQIQAATRACTFSAAPLGGSPGSSRICGEKEEGGGGGGDARLPSLRVLTMRVGQLWQDPPPPPPPPRA